MRTLGINLPFVEDSQKARLADAAQRAGLTPRFYDDAMLAAQGAADCEVFFGKMPASQLIDCPALKWFHCSFAGVDDYCDDKLYANPEVILSNSAGAYGITISEHMICTLLMMMRSMPKYVFMQQQRGWDRTGEMRSIYGSTVAVLGMGDIGGNFARRAKAMGAREVRGIRRDTQKPAPQGFDTVYPTDRLEEALRGADVLAVCLPATAQTRSIVDAETLGLLAPGAYVLNVGRGSAIDQGALRQALDSGHLAGAALDVTVPEPLPPTDPLWEASNLLITPHVSGNMSLSHTRELILSIFLDNLERYAQGLPLEHVVDRRAGY